MASFALQRHLGAPVTVKGACSWAGKALHKAAGGAYGVEAEVKRNVNGEITTVGDGEMDAARAFDVLGKTLLALGYDDGEACACVRVYGHVGRTCYGYTDRAARHVYSWAAGCINTPGCRMYRQTGLSGMTPITAARKARILRQTDADTHARKHTQ